jgi:mannonate dehydratase
MICESKRIVAQAEWGAMRIAAVEVIVCSPGRNFVTTKVTTDDGVVGYGDGTLNGRELAVVAYLNEHVAPALLGMDATRINDVWAYLYKGAYWRRGPVTMSAISAIDQALWDINAKALGVPVHRLLGGRARDYILTYPHCQGHDIEDVIADVAGRLREGYRAVRVQANVPGLATAYGVHDVRAARYEPASSALPEVEEWDTPSYLDFLPRLVAAVRDQLGYGFELLHDAHHRMTPSQAGWLGQRLEPYRLFWLEDPTPEEDQAAFRTVRSHTSTPLAVGEVWNSIHDCQQVITGRLIDYIRIPVTHGGGITHLRDILALANIYGVRSGMQGASDISPLGMAANLSLDWTIPNFGIQEYMGYPEQVWDVFRPHFRLEQGVITLDDTPGLGVDVDEEAARGFPYVPRSLPVNRLRDGTLTDW